MTLTPRILYGSTPGRLTLRYHPRSAKLYSAGDDTLLKLDCLHKIGTLEDATYAMDVHHTHGILVGSEEGNVTLFSHPSPTEMGEAGGGGGQEQEQEEMEGRVILKAQLGIEDLCWATGSTKWDGWKKRAQNDGEKGKTAKHQVSMITRVTAMKKYRQSSRGGLPREMIANLKRQLHHQPRKTHIRIINTNKLTEIKTIQGLPKCPLSVAWDPKSEYISLVISDGTLRVFSLETMTIARSFLDLAKEQPESKILLQHSWHPEGDFIAFPYMKDARIVKRNWETVADLKGHTETVSIVKYSTNGKFLATSAGRSLRIYSASTNKEILQWSSTDIISAIDWCPSRNELTLSTWDGEITIMADIVPEEYGSTFSEKITAIDSKPVKKAIRLNEEMSDVGMEDFGDESDDDFIEDDDGAGYVSEKKAAQEVSRPKLDRIVSKEVKEHPLFQPGSFDIQEKGNKIMAFNMLGTITSHDQDTHHTIDIEFHDINFGRAIHLKDPHGYFCAALNVEGACFGSKLSSMLEEEEGVEKTANARTCIYKFVPFGTWEEGEWSCTFGENEQILAVAAGSTWNAVATKAGRVHVFSNGGTLIDIFGTHGTMVSMTSAGELLMMLWSTGASYRGSQVLNFAVRNVVKEQQVIQGVIPSGADAYVTWIGFTDVSSPTYFDSKGTLWIWYEDIWRPVFDTKLEAKQKRETFWPIAVENDNLVCIIIKGGRFPTGKPVVSDMPLRLPVPGLTDPIREKEERWLRMKLSYQTQANEAKLGFVDNWSKLGKKLRFDLDKLRLEMLSEAIKERKTRRALDYAVKLYSEKSWDVATKLAVANAQPSLAQKLLQLRDSLQEEQPIEEQQQIEQPVRYAAAESDLFQEQEEEPTEDPLSMEPYEDTPYDPPAGSFNAIVEEKTFNPIEQETSLTGVTSLPAPTNASVLDSLRSSPIHPNFARLVESSPIKKVVNPFAEVFSAPPSTQSFANTDEVAAVNPFTKGASTYVAPPRPPPQAKRSQVADADIRKKKKANDEDRENIKPGQSKLSAFMMKPAA